MIRNIKTCDHCGKEYAEADRNGFEHKGYIKIYITSNGEFEDVTGAMFDICPDCEKEVRDSIIKYFNIKKENK